MDWPVLGSDIFMAIATVALVAAPLVGNQGGWRALPASLLIAVAVVCLASLILLGVSWRAIPGGFRAALLGHLALIISVAAMAELGRVARAVFADRLTGALAGISMSTALVIGVFAVGPLAGDVTAAQSAWLLLANPLVAVTSAAGIDLLHLDTIYRTSPLSHRGVAPPAWTTACIAYVIVGLACHGLSLIRPRRARLL